MLNIPLKPGDRVCGFTVPEVNEVHILITKWVHYSFLEKIFETQCRYYSINTMDLELRFLPKVLNHYLLKMENG